MVPFNFIGFVAFRGSSMAFAAVPFAARSLAFDGAKFWSNHRVANETVSFTLPG